MTALLTCGHTRAGLAAVRALGRAGIAVAVGAPMRPALAVWSRYATASLLVPDAGAEAKRFADTVGKEAEGRGAVLVLAATDAALWALSKWREKLPEPARRVLPPHDGVVRALDRSVLHDLAGSLKIRCIDTVRVDAQHDIERAVRDLSALDAMPALIRPLVPWIEREDGGRRVAESVPVESIGDLRRLLYTREDLVEGGCLIEPRPRSGRWLSYGVVCQNGVPFAEVFQERLRERRDLSGVSTLAVTLPPDEEVRQMGRTLLDAMQWQGPAMVELWRTDEGDLRLVSVVGRMWGSSQLAIDAGVNVPILTYRLAAGERIPDSPVVAAPGHRWWWPIGDVEVFTQRAARLMGRLEGSHAFAKRAAALVDILRPQLGGARSDVFDVDDPLPFIHELQDRVNTLRRREPA